MQRTVCRGSCRVLGAVQGACRAVRSVEGSTRVLGVHRQRIACSAGCSVLGAPCTSFFPSFLPSGMLPSPPVSLHLFGSPAPAPVHPCTGQWCESGLKHVAHWEAPMGWGCLSVRPCRHSGLPSTAGVSVASWVSACAYGSPSASASTSGTAGLCSSFCWGAAACVPRQGSCVAASVPQPTQNTDAVPAVPRCCVVGM